MTTVVSCVNLKGGVGKTALAVNFAAYCGNRKLKTLLIDVDPQTNATFSTIGFDEWERHAQHNGSVADLLGARRFTTAEGEDPNIENIIYKNAFAGVDLIPSHIDLFTVDLDLAGATARERRLSKALRPVKDKYDIIVCDCPPNLTIPTQNALAISDHYVVPISLDFLSGLGVGLLINRVKSLCEDLEHNINHAGIVISRVGRPATHRAQTETTLRATFGGLVLDETITERVKVSEAAEHHKPIYDMGDVVAADQFRNVSAEILNRIGL